MTSLADLVGVELGPTEWLEVTQERIDAYARATDDPQWIHTDPARAAEGPFGTTIAHGFLTLALTTPLLDEVLPPDGGVISLNYGMNRVRFPAPVPSGSRIRGRFRVASFEETPRGERALVEATVECDASEKPVCVAEVVVLTVS
jgi:acyl dehydratase